VAIERGPKPGSTGPAEAGNTHGVFNLLRTGPPERIEIDLARVTFLDCSGLGVLITARQAAAHSGGHLWVSGPRPIVRRVLDLTGLLDLFTTSPDQALGAGTG
jgi:anti-anti-sigma factor